MFRQQFFRYLATLTWPDDKEKLTAFLSLFTHAASTHHHPSIPQDVHLQEGPAQDGDLPPGGDQQPAQAQARRGEGRNKSLDFTRGISQNWQIKKKK